MRETSENKTHRDMDHMRLLGISRIPRCANCPRLPELAAALKRGSGRAGSLSDLPAGCRHEVCRPLVERYFRPAESPSPTLRLIEAGRACC